MIRAVEVEAGDGALLALYDAHVADVYGFVLRRCGRIELAEDLTQEVFVAAATRFRDMAEVPSPAWLYRVARSRLIDRWRREARGATKLRLVGAQEGSRAVGGDPAERVAAGERLVSVLDTLPASQRAVLILRYFDDYTVSQIAEELGRSVRATESLLARARRSFESEYGEVDGD